MEAVWNSALQNCRRECIDDQKGRQVVPHGPSDDLAVVKVKDYVQV